MRSVGAAYAQNPPITLRLVGVVHSPGPAFGFPPLPALSLMSLCSFTMPPCPSVHVLGPGPGPVFSLLALAGAVCAKKDRRLKGCAPVPPHAFALQRRTIGDLPGKRPPARRSSFLPSSPYCGVRAMLVRSSLIGLLQLVGGVVHAQAYVPMGWTMPRGRPRTSRHRRVPISPAMSVCATTWMATV